MARAGFPCVGLMRATPNKACPKTGGRLTVFDIIFIVLGFGGILVMAAYAVFCERI
jgi:hypothetical protein